MLCKQAPVGCLGSEQDKPEGFGPEARGEQRLQVACQRSAHHLQELCCSPLTPRILPCTRQIAGMPLSTMCERPVPPVQRCLPVQCSCQAIPGATDTLV